MLEDKYLEKELVNSARSGCLESFGRLFESYYGAMVSIGYSVLTDHQLAEDAAQESFARALVSLNKLRDNQKFGRWLAAICRNVAKDMLADKLKEVNSTDLSGQAQEKHCDERKRIVNEAIANLEVRDRELIILRYYSNLSYERLAEVLGISKAAVNGRLTRAKRKIAKYLKRISYKEKTA